MSPTLKALRDNLHALKLDLAKITPRTALARAQHAYALASVGEIEEELYRIEDLWEALDSAKRTT